MVVRRVFIAWSYPLFHQSVLLLLNHPEVEVVGSGTVLMMSQPEIERLQPDIIIIEKTEPDTSIDVATMQILENSAWSPNILRISLRDNKLWVCRCEQHTLQQAEDLLRLVVGGGVDLLTRL